MEAAQNRTELIKRPRVQQVLPTSCLSCESPAGYLCVRTTSSVQIKDESFDLTYECLECPTCKHRILSNNQMDARVCLTVRAYQEKHGLLTATEVVTNRRALGFKSQQAFVDAAPAVSIATLKRLEAGQHIQDTTTDFVLRMAFEQLTAKRQKEDLFAMLREPLSAPIEYDGIPTSVGGIWRFNNTALPLAACVTIMVSASMVNKDGAETWQATDHLPFETSSPC